MYYHGDTSAFSSFTGHYDGFRWVHCQQDSGGTSEGLLCLCTCHNLTVHAGSLQVHLRLLPVGRGTLCITVLDY